MGVVRNYPRAGRRDLRGAPTKSPQEGRPEAQQNKAM